MIFFSFQSEKVCSPNSNSSLDYDQTIDFTCQFPSPEGTPPNWGDQRYLVNSGKSKLCMGAFLRNLNCPSRQIILLLRRFHTFRWFLWNSWVVVSWSRFRKTTNETKLQSEDGNAILFWCWLVYRRYDETI